MRDVEAPGPDWLEGPENLEQEENQGREAPPTRCRTEAWSCCPFDVRVFLYAPSVTGRSWAGTRAGSCTEPLQQVHHRLSSFYIHILAALWPLCF